VAVTVPQQLTVDSLLEGTPLFGSVSLSLHDALLWPPGDPGAFADAARDILAGRWRWQAMRRAGLAAAAAFSEHRVAASVEEALRWVASDAWRVEP
jgi:hypothetical protein